MGLNGEVRYQILGRADEDTRRFAIDPVSGQVRAIASFARDAGKVFGFDVKATDRRGADDGKSSIANVFVRRVSKRNRIIIPMLLAAYSLIYFLCSTGVRFRRTETIDNGNGLKAN